MNILQIAQNHGLNPKRVASTKGGEYASACPDCGGKDRFRIQPENKGGRFFCRQCDKSGDAIQFLREFQGMSFKEAAFFVGKELDSQHSRRPYKLPVDDVPFMGSEKKILPGERWRREAAGGVAAAHEKLLSDSVRLGWLAGRGIDLDAVKRFKLGWIDESKFYGLSRWGLPEVVNEKGNKKRLWIPKGYIIPQWNLEGEISMLQVRMDELLKDSVMRYYPVKGSTVTPMIIPPMPSLAPERTAWVIVESRLDAILVARYAGDLVGVMAQGNNSANPCPEAMPLLDASPCILNALDFDVAGDESFKKWARRFKTARRWPVPESKDPAEYVQENNGDIRKWILAGLPPGLRISRKVDKVADSTGGDQVTHPGEKKQNLSGQGSMPLITQIESKCGRDVYITGDRDTYRSLEDEKKIVFSEQEVGRATAFKEDGGDPATLIDIKEIFGGGRIIKRIEL